MVRHHYTADYPGRPKDNQGPNGAEPNNGGMAPDVEQPMQWVQHNPQRVRILQGQVSGTPRPSEGDANAGGGIYVPQNGGTPAIMTLAAQTAGTNHQTAQQLYQVQPNLTGGGTYQLQTTIPMGVPVYNAQGAYVVPEQGYAARGQWQAPNSRQNT
jgi:hypothetical protein